MTTNSILTASLDDIIFDGRNKLYGAYELRHSYAKMVGKALLVTGLLIGVAIGTYAITGSKSHRRSTERMGPVVKLTQVVEKKVEQIPPPEKKVVAQQPEVKTVKLTTIAIVENPSAPPPSVDEIAKSAIGTAPKDGIDYSGKVAEPGPQVIEGNSGIVEIPQKEVPEGPFTEVAIQARFIGNWSAFLLNNLNGNVPVDNGAQPGRYTVLIQFVVDVDGSVSNIIPLTSLGYGMEEEAVRVLKRAKGWEPAIQNGIKVKAYRKQPITFEVLDES